jgi:vacuolar-type H+-ATPase subunit F/Vma7
VRIVLLGDEDDVRGFGLAGVHGIVARTREQIVTELRRIGRDRTVALLLVSEPVRRRAPAAVRAVEDGCEAPLVLTLPAPPSSAARSPGRAPET